MYWREQDFCQIEGDDQPLATRIDSKDDPLVEGPVRETQEPGPPIEGDVQSEEESDTESLVHNRFQRRLILNVARDPKWDSGGEAEMEHQERDDTVEEPQDVLWFANLDEVDLAEVFEVRACLMKSMPKFMSVVHIVGP